MEPPRLSALLMLADGRLPSGGHAHSGGLEEAVRRGAVTDRSSLEAWLQGRLHTTGRVDAAFAAAAAYEAAARRAGRPDRWDGLGAELAARLPSDAARRASRAQGRGLLRVAVSAWPAPWLRDLRAAEPSGPLWPLGLGAAAVAAGLEAPEAALLGASAAVQGPAWAVTRLLGLNPFDVAAVLAGLAGSVDAAARQAAGQARAWSGADLPGWGAPLSDIGAQIHATWEVRLFAS